MSGSNPIDTVAPSRDPVRALSGAIRAVLHHECFEDAARTIFDLGKELIGATAGYVALLADDGVENEVLFLDAGGKTCSVDPTLPMPIRGLREQAYLSCRPVYENDFSGSHWAEFLPQGHARLDNVLFAPLVIDERAVGLIGLANKPAGFTDEDVEHAAALGEIAAIALDNAGNLKRLNESEVRLHSELAINTRLLSEANEVMTAVLEHTDIMAVLLDKNFDFIWVNRSYADLRGHDPEFYPGKNHFDLYPNQEDENLFRHVMETGEPHSVDAKAFALPDRPELGVTYWDWSLAPVRNPTGEVASLLFTLVDATEQSRARMAAELIERLHQSAEGHSLHGMLIETLDGLCELLESPIGFYHFVEPDQKTLSLQAWSTSTLAHFCKAEGSGLHYDVDQAGVWADCLRERRPVVHNDYHALKNKRGMPKGHAEVTRELVVPIFREQRIVGILGVGNRTRDYIEKDTALVSHVAGVAWEIAQRIRANEELTRSEARYRHSLGLFPEAVLMIRDGRIVYANAACVNLLGARGVEDLLGAPVIERVDPAYREQARIRIERLLKWGGIAPLRAARFLRMDGSPIDVEVTATVFDTPEGSTLEVVVRDLSERKRAEEALKTNREKLSELASELIRTSEREQHRLAVDLHDGIGQALAAAKISARTIAEGNSGSAVTENGSRLLELLDYSIQHVRALTAQLSPPALYELGLIPALERLVEDLDSLYGIECALRIERVPENLTEDTRRILFRAARELLSNVHRHSGVDVACLTLEERHNSAFLRVEDEGHGFDANSLDTGTHTDCFGLFSLKEEVRNAGGTVTIRSTPDSGTSVEVSVPLRRQK